MEGTKILMDEHRVIERFLTTLGRAAMAAEAVKGVKPEFFLESADFIKGFADGCHHAKEEKVLFEAMIKAGVPREGSPVSAMLAEHEQGRAFVRAMRAGAEKWQAGDEAGRAEVVTAAKGYVQLLRAHIGKEDNILFPLADRTISPDAQQQVAEDFERVEHEETGEGVHEKYLGQAEKLEKESFTN
ncbi:MAG: hemerythrin domain-containing protein [Anaerolineaceae bacterium]